LAASVIAMRILLVEDEPHAAHVLAKGAAARSMVFLCGSSCS